MMLASCWPTGTCNTDSPCQAPSCKSDVTPPHSQVTRHLATPSPSNASHQLHDFLHQSWIRVREQIFLSVSEQPRTETDRHSEAAISLLLYSLLTWGYLCWEAILKICLSSCTRLPVQTVVHSIRAFCTSTAHTYRLMSLRNPAQCAYVQSRIQSKSDNKRGKCGCKVTCLNCTDLRQMHSHVR